MLALFRGAGRLPECVTDALTRNGTAFVTCQLDATIPAEYHVTLGHLGSLLATLKDAGVSQVCMAGGLDRTALQIGQPDELTLPLLMRLQTAMSSGDGAALAVLHEIFEEFGFQVVAAQTICPDLLPSTGHPTRKSPDLQQSADAMRGFAVLDQIGPADIGQGCVIEAGQVVAIEALPGTAAMLEQVQAFRSARSLPRGGVFVKAPKPGQDRRTDLPVIGPDTARQAIAAGLAGIAIEAGGVMVLDQAKTIDALDRAGMFLWVAER